VILSAIAIATWAGLAVHAARVNRSTPRLIPDPQKPAVRPGAVTALMPARNEAEIVETSVRALLQQGPSLARAIVIDDKSTDETPEILGRLAALNGQLVVIPGRGPGEGECGKPAALRDAMERLSPSTEWLLFIDADVVLELGAVDALLELGDSHDLVSVLPKLEMNTTVERWLMPSIVALVSGAYPPAKIADPESPVAFANGQIILIRRDTYAAVGGHGSVVKEVLEDVRLAERVKKAGGRLCLADGRLAARTRMYAGARELIEGWSKNLYLLVGGRPAPAFAWMLLTTLLPSLGWLALLVDRLPFGVLAFAFVTAVQMVLRRRIGAPLFWTPLAPLAALATDLLILRSAWVRRRGRVAWKGRVYR